MKRGLIIAFLVPAMAVFAAGPEQEIAAVLDDFHKAAAQAEGARYFGHFTDDAVFLGTDGSERWSVEQFRAYARPHFERGQGWNYIPRERHVRLGPAGASAWFDEILYNEKYGLCRGTGVLVKTGEAWKIAQYHLAVPVPNDLLPEVVKMIRSR